MSVRQARTTCPLDCPDACSLIALIDDDSNTLLKIEGDPAHPVTQGFACVKTYRYPERNHHPLRPLHPLKRVGPKGAGEFVRVGWEEALDEIAARVRSIVAAHGPEAVLPYHYAGTMGLVEYEHPLTFFRALGASALETTICASAGSAAWEASYGPRFGVDPEDVPQAKFVLLWGINSLHTNTHLTPFLKQARQGGARIVHIDPYENLTSRFTDEHIRIRPGTDAALAYGMARAIVKAGLHDAEYLEKTARGFEAFMEVAEAWTPERVEAATGVPAETVERIALEFAKAKASFVRTSYGLTRHPGGASMLRAVILLPAITGAWKYVGGGALLSTSGGFPLNRQALAGRKFLTDRPQPRSVNMTQIGTALTRLEPPIRSLFVFNSNPAVVAPRSELVQRGLMRDDLFTVVLEQAMTETTKYADYVLPATTFLEHPDLYTAYGHYYISWNEAVMRPQGEARPNTWVFAELGKRLGLDEPTLYWDAETLARSLLDSRHPWLEGVTLERLKAEGYVRIGKPRGHLAYLEGAETPSGKIQFDPPPQVILTEPEAEFPLILMTPPAKHFLNSTYGHVERLVNGEGGEPVLLIHPADAEARGVVSGQYVRIRSRYGEVRRRAKVGAIPIQGTVVLEGTWWERPAPDGRGINWLTGEHLTDMGAGSTFHSNPVEVEALGGAADD
ncbi:MAG: molybdopterin oxidoreductase family protein [Meiothermus sp.]|nr:molybdopterin oxidoreductase family protein [Meiothermus sp.]